MRFGERAKAARRCDELAANPNDPRRVGEGVAFQALKTQAREAITSCELAVTQNPNELRLKYQLGRVLEWVDRKKPLGFIRSLLVVVTRRRLITWVGFILRKGVTLLRLWLCLGGVCKLGILTQC
jgi:hypothetical protein